MDDLLPGDQSWSRLPPHPRLLLSAAKLADLRQQDDVVSRTFMTLLRADAAVKLNLPPVVYPHTGFKFGAMREVQGRVITLALLFRLTGEKEYLEGARRDLLGLATLPDWCPEHFLDTGEGCLAAGIGLDWLYDELTSCERALITQAIVKNALRPSLQIQEGQGHWIDGNFNWNQVCHAGLCAGALAIAECEPELARHVVSRALCNVPRAGAVYADDGAYPEGPSYWSYGTSFHVILIELLRSTLGHAYGLEAFAGFLKTPEFKLQMMAPTRREFDYSDYHFERYNEPIMFWFARELRRPDLQIAELDNLRLLLRQLHGPAVPDGQMLNQHRLLGFEFLWWDPAFAGSEPCRRLPTHWTARGNQPLAVMRSAWCDPDASFLALKGGSPHHSHGHMDVGSFVLEANGVRWALDLGTENYGRMRSAGLDLWNYDQESSRWATFRVGPEGHNILRCDGAGQMVHGRGEIETLPAHGGSVGNRVLLTNLYRPALRQVERLARLHQDGSMSVEDHWTTGERAVQVAFQWLTRANVEITPSGFTLREAGELLTVQVVASGQSSLEIQDVSRPVALQDSPNPGLTRLVIRQTTGARSRGSFRVQAVPGSAVP